jgi:two-component system, NtrC family, nitrogen regulation response regulator GlnG
VRVIAATHQNLEQRVRDGLFREDLYHRLNVIRLRLPPLRERPEDIPLLTRHFLAKSARELGVEPKKLSPEALKFIQALLLPGNVRQLENLCHWLTVLAPAQVVKVDDLPLEIRSETAAGAMLAPPAAPVSPTAPATVSASIAAVAAPSATDWLALLVEEVSRRLAAGEREVMDELGRQFEAAVIRTALKHTHGRRIEAASRLGVGRNTITRKIQELGLED